MANQANINSQTETQGAPGHTPGPWKVIEPAAIDYRAPLVYGAGGGSLVAVAEGGGPKRAVVAAEARANARLIAAAPDMLKALKEISRNAAISDEWLAPVRAAIAKAKGRAS